MLTGLISPSSWIPPVAVTGLAGYTVSLGGWNSTPAAPDPKPRKKLCELTKQEYAILKIWGFLNDLYPQATGDWEVDKVVPPTIVDSYSVGSFSVSGSFMMSGAGVPIIRRGPNIAVTGGGLIINNTPVVPFGQTQISG